MRPRQGMQGKVIAGGIVLALLLLHPFAYAQEPVAPQGTSNQSQGQVPASAQPDASGTAAAPSMNQSSGDQLPDSPGAVPTKPNPPQAMKPSTAPADNSKSSDPDPAPSQQSDTASNPGPPVPPSSPQPNDQDPDRSSFGQPASGQTGTQPFAQSQQQQSPHDPLGTAAAESVPTTGIAASRPAGAAVAPAKQRRVRSILIKVGALVGAGVAIGTTMALSQGSPSKPPGSH